MKPKTMMLMVVAIVCGLVASYLTSRMMAERTPAPSQNMKKVLVAIKKVPMYTPIKKPEEYFVEKDVPEDAVPKKAIANFDDLKGKKLNKAINEEAFVYVDDLLDPKSDGMAAMLSQGQRAVAIKVDAQSLVGGFVLPGSRVDVVCAVNRGTTPESESKILLQDMLVLAVDTKNNKEEGQSSILGQTVTLAAKPEEALQLTLAAGIGELRLLLRGHGDNQILRVPPTKVVGLGRQRFDASGSENADAGSTLISQPPVPSVLPPVPPKTEPPVVQAPTVEAPKAPPPPPVKTHTLTIVSGDTTTRHLFVADAKEGWKSQVSQTESEDARRGQREMPPALPTATPATPEVRPAPGSEAVLPPGSASRNR